MLVFIKDMSQLEAVNQFLISKAKHEIIYPKGKQYIL